MTPTEIEDAATAAVARFHARNGAIPDPPAPDEIPPRIPVPSPPRADRACPPRQCYCGGLGPDPLPGACPWWTPAPTVLAERRTRPGRGGRAR